MVTPELERDPDKGEIDLIFKVEQGPRLTIERIEIRGNSRTRDYVIRASYGSLKAIPSTVAASRVRSSA